MDIIFGGILVQYGLNWYQIAVNMLLSVAFCTDMTPFSTKSDTLSLPPIICSNDKMTLVHTQILEMSP